MNRWTQRLKSVYRKEPVISFVVTAGTVNVAIGSLSEHWSLASVGLGAVGVAIALHLRQRYTHRPIEPQHRSPVYVLPPAAQSLPLLSITKKQPPGR